MIREKIMATGKVNVTLTRENGDVEKDTDCNLVVTTGRNHIADQLTDQGDGAMSHMAIGEGTGTQVIADTALGSEVSGGRVAFTTKVQGTAGNTVVYTADWPPGVGTGLITEAGIFNSSTVGIMLARTTFGVKDKGVGDSMSIQWTVTIAGA